MKNYFKLSSLFLLSCIVPFVLTCSKERSSSPIIDTEWEVSSITAPGRDYIILSPTPYKMTFHKDNIYNMRLDVNSCGSTYRLENVNNIFIDPIYCTQICCDKVFADTLLNILKNVNTFNITGEDLELISPNRIINLTKLKNR